MTAVTVIPNAMVQNPGSATTATSQKAKEKNAIIPPMPAIRNTCISGSGF